MTRSATLTAGALLLVVGAGVLTACSSADPVPTASAASTPAGSSSPAGEGGIALGGTELPPGWPEVLPSFEGGTLVSASVSDGGRNVNAVWGTDSTPAEAWAAMDAALREQGFVPVGETGVASMLIEDATMKTDDYVRDGFEANLVVLTGEQTSVLLNASQL